MAHNTTLKFSFLLFCHKKNIPRQFVRVVAFQNVVKTIIKNVRDMYLTQKVNKKSNAKELFELAHHTYQPCVA